MVLSDIACALESKTIEPVHLHSMVYQIYHSMMWFIMVCHYVIWQIQSKKLQPIFSVFWLSVPVFWVLHLKALRNVNLWPGAPPHSAAIWGQTNSHYAWVNIRDLEGPTVVLTALSGFYTWYIIIQLYSRVLVYVFIFLEISKFDTWPNQHNRRRRRGTRTAHVLKAFLPQQLKPGGWHTVDAGNPCDGLMIHHFFLGTHGFLTWSESTCFYHPSLGCPKVNHLAK